MQNVIHGKALRTLLLACVPLLRHPACACDEVTLEVPVTKQLLDNQAQVLIVEDHANRTG